MSLLKSLFSGIGTGAGMAWPLFGIVFAILGAAIGGPVSLALGLTSIALFFAVTIPVFYLLHKEQQRLQSNIQLKLSHNQLKLAHDINGYLQQIYNQYLNEHSKLNVKEYLNTIIADDLREITQYNKNSPLHLLLKNLKHHVHKMSVDAKPEEFSRIAKDVATQLPKPPAPLSLTLTSGFFGFVGTFGSIAGCSAGTAGMLAGLGLFTTFAAFPLVGWSILSVAALFGLIVAHHSAQSADEHYQKNELIQLTAKMRRQLEKATCARNKVIHPIRNTEAVSCLSFQKQAVTERLPGHAKTPLFKPVNFIATNSVTPCSEAFQPKS